MKIRRYIDSLDQDASVRVPIEFELTSDEILEAYWEQQHFYDIADVENELREQWDVYAEKYHFDLYEFCPDDITEEEIEVMADELRRILDQNCDACWSKAREEAVNYVLCMIQQALEESRGDKNGG